MQLKNPVDFCRRQVWVPDAKVQHEAALARRTVARRVHERSVGDQHLTSRPRSNAGALVTVRGFVHAEGASAVGGNLQTEVAHEDEVEIVRMRRKAGARSLTIYGDGPRCQRDLRLFEQL